SADALGAAASASDNRTAAVPSERIANPSLQILTAPALPFLAAGPRSRAGRAPVTSSGPRRRYRVRRRRLDAPFLVFVRRSFIFAPRPGAPREAFSWRP